MKFGELLRKDTVQWLKAEEKSESTIDSANEEKYIRLKFD